jgi:hypothetical protein
MMEGFMQGKPRQTCTGEAVPGRSNENQHLVAAASGRTEKWGMTMLKKILIGLALMVLISAGIALGGKAHKEDSAVAAAAKWLSLVDQGQYAASWKEAAPYFKKAVKQKQWGQSLQAVRKPLGKLISRKVQSTIYTTSLPGAPDGEYVVIQFKTSFENKKSAIETVTPMMDKDGKWRVSGYFIK